MCIALELIQCGKWCETIGRPSTGASPRMIETLRLPSNWCHCYFIELFDSICQKKWKGICHQRPKGSLDFLKILKNWFFFEIFEKFIFLRILKIMNILKILKIWKILKILKILKTARPPLENFENFENFEIFGKFWKFWNFRISPVLKHSTFSTFSTFSKLS